MSKLDYTFSDDYLVLRPDRAGVFALCHLLVSSHVWKNSAVDCFTGTEVDDIGRRWALFVSLFLQALLLRIKKPLALLGSAVEFVANLFFILLQGDIEFPDQTSPSYRSITNLIGTRIKFDERIKTKNVSEFDAEISAAAARLAYENEPFIRDIITHHWQMEFLGFYYCWNAFQDCYSAQAIVFSDKPADAELVVVAFRGTEPFDAVQLCSDIDLSWYEIPKLGKVHAGFMNALGLHKNIGWPKRIEHRKTTAAAKPAAYYAIRDTLKTFSEMNKKARLLVTGHGSGGALATLFPVILAYHKETSLLERLEGVYTFEQPRVGDATLRLFVESHLDMPKRRLFWTMQRDDAVPFADDSDMAFNHFVMPSCFNSFNKLKVLLTKEMNITYFSLLETIQTFAISAFLFVLSFFHSCSKTPGLQEADSAVHLCCSITTT